MKSEIIENSGLKRKLKIQLDSTEVSSALELEFKKIQSTVELKGFRKGKAPMDKVKSMYGPKVSQTVLEDLVNQNYFAALKEHKLSPVAMPIIDVDKKSEEGGGFAFTAEVEVRPEIKIGDLSKIKVKKEKPNATEEKLETQIQTHLASKAEVTAVLEDRPAKEKDWVKIDFSGTLTESGEPIQNGSANDFLLELGSNSLIEGFEEGIVGMKPADKKTLNLAFPKDYFQSELAAKPVTFEVTLNSINKKDFPELTDEFVKESLGLESVKDYKDKVKAEIEKNELQQVETKLNNDLLSEFEKIHSIEVPESIVKEQAKSLKDATTQRLKMQGMSDESIEDYHTKWEDDYKKDAQKGVKTSFLVEALATQQELYPKEKDIAVYYEDLAKKTGIDTDKIASYYGTPEKQKELEFKIMEENVISYIKSKATVSE